MSTVKSTALQIIIQALYRTVYMSNTMVFLTGISKIINSPWIYNSCEHRYYFVLCPNCIPKTVCFQGSIHSGLWRRIMLCFCALIIDSYMGSMVIKKSPIGTREVLLHSCM